MRAKIDAIAAHVAALGPDRRACRPPWAALPALYGGTSRATDRRAGALIAIADPRFCDRLAQDWRALRAAIRQSSHVC